MAQAKRKKVLDFKVGETVFATDKPGDIQYLSYHMATWKPPEPLTVVRKLEKISGCIVVSNGKSEVVCFPRRVRRSKFMEDVTEALSHEPA